jgi:pimeloyl-ACP methyl ester carboxylesterase
MRQPAPGARAVVLVPGFISGDVSLTCLGRELRRAGLRTFRSRIGANLGCTETMVDRLGRRLESVVAAEGRPVAVVGHSRGGMIVALAARRRPDLVAGVVVLAAPVTGSLSVAPHVRAQLDLLFRLNRRGLRRVLAEECVTGACADRVVAELRSPFPASVPYTSVYSRNDAILDWRACLDPAAEQVEVRAGHTAMAVDPDVQRIVVARLADRPRG